MKDLRSQFITFVVGGFFINGKRVKTICFRKQQQLSKPMTSHIVILPADKS